MIRRIIIVLGMLFIAANVTAQTNWVKYAGNPVLPSGDPGEWDWKSYPGCVLHEDTLYKMWYVGWDGSTSRIGYATSPDGIDWTKANSINPILDLGPGGSFDDEGITSPCVLYDDNIYKMWYSGYDGSGSHTDRIGYATSVDGITWEKADSINPVMDFGPAWWENSGVFGSKIIIDNGIYKMWYAGWNETNVRIGHAASLDGINWIKADSMNPVLDMGPYGSWDDYSVNDPMVLLSDSTYQMWYMGHDGTRGCIGYATSQEGITWDKADSVNPVLQQGSYGSFDDRSVRGPWVLLEGDIYKMWYIGVYHDGFYGTGYATDSSNFPFIPHIVSTSPSQNELNILLDTNISVTFDIDMDESTINDSTFVVNARSTGLHDGIISYDSLTNTATFNPIDDFDVGEVVTVVLTTEIQSSLGVPLDSSHIWSFTLVAQIGSATFPSHIDYPVGDFAHCVFAADLDGDYDLDLAVANIVSYNVSILLNNGDGTFSPQSVYPVGPGPHFVYAADFDGDGDIDLTTANGYSNSVSVLLNNGNGTFATHSIYTVGIGPVEVYGADLDGDGDIDLSTGNFDSNNISVLTNNGDGTFGGRSDYPAGSAPQSVFAADLDDDGDSDLTVANLYSDNISIYLNHGDGTFASPSFYDVGDEPIQVFAADLDGDGDLDLTTSNILFGDVSVLMNNGNGTFAPHVSYPVGDTAVSVFAADLDGDGDLDLTTANYGSGNISVLLNNGNGTFAPHSVYPVSHTARSIFAADFDNDGDLDLAVPHEDYDNVSILLNSNAGICDYVVGDANNSEDFNGLDVTYGVSYFKGGSAPPYECECTVGNTWYVAGDVNGSCNYNGLDITYGVAYFKGGPDPVPCPDCPPVN